MELMYESTLLEKYYPHYFAYFLSNIIDPTRVVKNTITTTALQRVLGSAFPPIATPASIATINAVNNSIELK
ncbi:hypothetical protein [Halogeometricum borinquense]|uniref:hypothetical protein n=1 Tax=Halogeometricum borinquense TaxID=60847 RepID=UPI0013EB4132|nr:hypothetical protein [Halogeometricum borinquense]